MKSKYSNSEFSKRHIGSNQDQVKAMLKEIGYDSMDGFIEETIPNQIRFKGNLNVGDSVDEYELIHSLKMIASKNKPFKSEKCNYSCAQKVSMNIRVAAVHEKKKLFKCKNVNTVVL